LDSIDFILKQSISITFITGKLNSFLGVQQNVDMDKIQWTMTFIFTCWSIGWHCMLKHASRCYEVLNEACLNLVRLEFYRCFVLLIPFPIPILLTIRVEIKSLLVN